MMVEYSGIVRNSCDDDPNIRTVVFFQGCSKNCKGCHNPSTHKRGAGKNVSVGDLHTLLRHEARNKRVTISGGEPLEQREALSELLRLLKKDNFEICLYTGRQLEDVPYHVLMNTDYIKVGGFVSEKVDPRLHFVGSSNQRMFRVKEGRISEELNLFDGC